MDCVKSFEIMLWYGRGEVAATFCPSEKKVVAADHKEKVKMMYHLVDPTLLLGAVRQ